jgi:hypothetical protein
MDQKDAFPTLPDSVETLLDWKLANSDAPFNDEEFLADFEKNADDANLLFDKAFPESDCIE